MAQQALPYTLPDIPNNVAWQRTGEMFSDLYALQSRTVSAADIRFASGGTPEARIQKAIDEALVEGARIVQIPTFMLPYDITQMNQANLAAFAATGGRLTREAGDSSVYDVEAYGAGPTGTAAGNKAAIQRAITDSAAQHNVAVLSRMYDVNDYLVCPSFTTLTGKGAGSGIRCSAAHTSTAIINSNAATGNTDIRLSNFEIDGNKANRSAGINLIHFTTAEGTYNQRITIENIYAHDSKSTAGANGLGIVLGRTHGGRISGCHVSGDDRDGITLYYDCQDVFIGNNWIHDCNDDFIGLNAENDTTTGHVMTRIEVVGNLLTPQGANGGAGIAVRGVQHSVVANNVIYQGFSAGIDISNWNTSPSTDLVISNNVLIDAGANNSGANGMGIAITAARGVSSLNGKEGCRRILVMGNVIKNPRAHGIRVLGEATVTTSDITISHNNILCGTLYSGGRGIIGDVGPVTDIHITDNVVRDAQAQGIFFKDTVNPYVRVHIERNRVFNSGRAGTPGTPTAAGIEVEAVLDAVIRNNRSTDLAAGGSKTTTYGGRIVNCTGALVITGNDCRGNGTSSFNFTGTGSLTAGLRIRDNVGYSPWAGQVSLAAGSWSTVTIGAQTYYYKESAVTYTVPFPAGVLPRVTATTDTTGLGASALSPTNTGVTIRAWTLRNDSPAVLVDYVAESQA